MKLWFRAVQTSTARDHPGALHPITVVPVAMGPRRGSITEASWSRVVALLLTRYGCRRPAVPEWGPCAMFRNCQLNTKNILESD